MEAWLPFAGTRGGACMRLVRRLGWWKRGIKKGKVGAYLLHIETF